MSTTRPRLVASTTSRSRSASSRRRSRSTARSSSCAGRPRAGHGVHRHGRPVPRAQPRTQPGAGPAATSASSSTTRGGPGALEAQGRDILPGPRLDFLDPWGNRIQIVDYRDIQFTKAPPVIAEWGWSTCASGRRNPTSCAPRDSAKSATWPVAAHRPPIRSMSRKSRAQRKLNVNEQANIETGQLHRGTAKQTTHILGISGGLRSEPHNRKLPERPENSHHRRSRSSYGTADAKAAVDEDDDNDPGAAVVELRDAIERADAGLIATPHYNPSLPGQLKNALDSASRPYANRPPSLGGGDQLLR